MACPRVPAYRARMGRGLAVLLVAACTTAPQWTKDERFVAECMRGKGYDDK
jgi:hypothetical protein